MAEARSTWAQAMGDAIRDALALGHRTQRWLAKETGADPATISRFIRGEQLPTLDQIDEIADALHISRHALLTSAGYIVDPDGSARWAISNDPLLSADAKRALLGAYDSVVAGLRERTSDGVTEDR